MSIATFQLQRALLVTALWVATLLGANTAHGFAALVTNGNDTGPGSFREALASGADEIVMVTTDNITITSTLSYSGRAPLTIVGAGQLLSSLENVTLLEVSNGAGLTISNLYFRGPGGFSINNRADLEGDAGKGIFVNVADDESDTVTLRLTNVAVSDVANHGIHVSDCDQPDDCGGGGAEASIHVILSNVIVENVGRGRFDADGLRVDERDAGDIILETSNSLFTRVGADGVALDEGQDGIVRTSILNTTFSDNGNYCDPAVLETFIPDPGEAQFEDGVAMEADIPGPVTDSPDDRCIEREVDLYESGFVAAYTFGIDLDDGIDIGEAGNGSVVSLMVDTTISGNFEEGVDYHEDGAGGIASTYINTVVSGNNDDGYKHSEEGAGAVLAWMYASQANDNGGVGAVYEEKDDGLLVVLAENSSTTNNDDSDNSGLVVVQADEGSGELTIRNSTLEDGFRTEGVTVVEE
jgi:hypothetical protein